MLPEIPTDRTYLRLRQREELERQKAGLERQLSNPNNEDAGSLRRRLSHTNQALAEGSPPELTGSDFDEAVREEKRLEAKIRQGMLSDEEMKRNPNGAVPIHKRWIDKNLADAIRWKNLRLITRRNDSGDDVCDIDELRPALAHLSMVGAQIERKRAYSFPSEAYRENFDASMGINPDETLEQRRVRLQADLEATDKALAMETAAAESAARAPKGPVKKAVAAG